MGPLSQWQVVHSDLTLALLTHGYCVFLPRSQAVFDTATRYLGNFSVSDNWSLTFARLTNPIAIYY